MASGLTLPIPREMRPTANASKGDSNGLLEVFRRIRDANASFNAGVQTRQVNRAQMRKDLFLRVGPVDICDLTRKERRSMARAKAAGQWRRWATATD